MTTTKIEYNIDNIAYIWNEQIKTLSTQPGLTNEIKKNI